MDFDTTNISLRIKVTLIGDISVGKTSIMNRFIDNVYKDDYDPSIGVDFGSKTIRFQNVSIKMQLWDTAGQEKYKALIPSYIKGSSIVILLFDLSNKASYENVPNWISYMQKIYQPSLVVLCGNKVDLTRQIEFKDAYDYATNLNMLYFEVSAKEDIDVNKMFYTALSCLECFDDIRDSYKNLAQDLEIENEAKTNISILNLDQEMPGVNNNVEGKNNNSNSINIKIDDTKTKKVSSKKCKC